VSHGTLGLYHGIFYGVVLLVFFTMLWRWRRWYVSTDDGARARQSLWSVGGAGLLFIAAWFTCGRTSMALTGLSWVVPPIAAAGVTALAVGLRHAGLRH